jgi:hypothetical protein
MGNPAVPAPKKSFFCLPEIIHRKEEEEYFKRAITFYSVPLSTGVKNCQCLIIFFVVTAGDRRIAITMPPVRTILKLFLTINRSDKDITQGYMKNERRY